MNVLFTHAYSKYNKGDAGIVSVMVRQFQGIFPNVRITIANMEPHLTESIFEGVSQAQSFFYLAVYSSSGTLKRAIKSSYMLLATTLWAIFFRYFKIQLNFILTKKTELLLKAYEQSDLIVPVGGGYLQQQKTFYAHIGNLFKIHAIWIGILLRKPVILYSQSIGPFDSWVQKYLTAQVLNSTKGIMVREDFSLAMLEEMEVRKDLVIRGVDIGFLLESEKSRKSEEIFQIYNVDKTRKTLGITVREWMDKEKQHYFENQIAVFVDYVITNMDMNVMFIPETIATFYKDDDRVVANRVREKIVNKERVYFVNEDFTPHEIKSIYENLDFCIGTRMHSNIFALSSYVPVIAIQYEYKTRGIMNDLKLSEWVIDIEDVTSELLIKTFIALQKNREFYVSHLKNILPDYLEKAKKDIYTLKDIYTKSIN